MLGRLEIPRLEPPELRLCTNESTVEAVNEAHPNQRKAQMAWASWQRLDMLAEPLVMELLIR